MIQRIQSIYLLLAIVVMVVFIFSPFAISGDSILLTKNNIALVIISAVVGVISLVNIFLFKSRKLQMQLCTLAIIGIIAAVGWGIYSAIAVTGNDIPHYGAVFPIAGIIFEWLAKRGIRADEKLVRSAERLR